MEASSDYNPEHNEFFLNILGDDKFNRRGSTEDSFFHYNDEANLPEDSPAMLQKKLNYQAKYKSILELEAEMDCLKEQIKSLREREQNRILKEFLQNNYEKTFKVTIEVILQALFGYSRSQKVMQSLKNKTE